MMKMLSVDRFEGNYVICEDSEKKFFAIEKAEAPAGIAEGDILRITDDGAIEIDREETARRKKSVAARQQRVWED
ncbi:MAG: DUF3006 domain-containing protein [Firmicutes bacterium]|nr:DUF3006 domain-containing protein [Bacillota bacterium]